MMRRVTIGGMLLAVCLSGVVPAFEIRGGSAEAAYGNESGRASEQPVADAATVTVHCPTVSAGALSGDDGSLFQVGQSTIGHATASGIAMHAGVVPCLSASASGAAGEPTGESFFALSVAGDGTVRADFADPGGLANPNVFILQEAAGAFQAGQIGVTSRVQSGSDFSFRIEGQEVRGEINLNGVPARTGGAVDFYVGTFRGTLRR